MKNQKGFSLIELLIVVVIIGIIAAIAIPNLLASRRSANEGSAVSAMRSLNGANATYFATLGKNKWFAPSEAELKDEELIDAALAGAFGTGNEKSGYTFTYNPTDGVVGGTAADTTKPKGYNVNADPSSGYDAGVTRTGSRGFYVDQTGVIHEEDAGPADDTSNALGQ